MAMQEMTCSYLDGWLNLECKANSPLAELEGTIQNFKDATDP